MDIGTELRWILVACGAVLLAGIYFWGRRRRSATQQDQVALDPPYAARSEPRVTHEESSFVTERRMAADEPVITDEVASDDLPDIRIGPASTAVQGRREPVLGEDGTDDREEAIVAEPEPVLAADDGEPVVEHQPFAAREVPVVDTVQERNVAAAPASIAEAPDAPAARKHERRKIVALRIGIAAGNFDGGKLRALFASEALQHGKYGIYHRLHDGQSVFSVASMVEPGTFEPATMHEKQYPGLTVFGLLPGPLDGLVVFDQMLTCARRLEQALGGVLQDERGARLTPQLAARLRNDVLDFQHLLQ